MFRLSRCLLPCCLMNLLALRASADAPGLSPPRAADPRRVYDGALFPDALVEAFKHSDTLFPSTVVRRRGTVRALPAAARPLGPVRFTANGQSYDLADYLALNRVAGLLVLIPTGLSLAHLLTGHGTSGPTYVMFLLLLVWAADVGAYFAGRAFGRHALAPLVSPKKTWEGAAGGVVLAALVAAGGVEWFHRPAGPFIALAMVTVVASIVGDLTESLFKRNAGLKESGKLLPGHGGVLDRIDSVTAAAPVFALGLGLIGAAP